MRADWLIELVETSGQCPRGVFLDVPVTRFSQPTVHTTPPDLDSLIVGLVKGASRYRLKESTQLTSSALVDCVAEYR